MLTASSARTNLGRRGLGAWKFSLFASTCFAVPFAAAAFLFGTEFPALLGGLIGTALVVSAAKKGFLLPKESWEFRASIRMGKRVDWRHPH